MARTRWATVTCYGTGAAPRAFLTGCRRWLRLLFVLGRVGDGRGRGAVMSRGTPPGLNGVICWRW